MPRLTGGISVKIEDKRERTILFRSLHPPRVRVQAVRAAKKAFLFHTIPADNLINSEISFLSYPDSLENFFKRIYKN